MPSPQKTKGKGYENVVAKFLTDTYGEKFLRVPSSGSFLGGSNFHRRHTMTEGQVRSFKGDIIPPDSWSQFNCECKFYKSFNFHQLFTESKILDKWITETLDTANTGDLSLIFMKFNNLGEYIAYQSTENFIVNQYTTYKNNWHFTSHSAFWTPHNTIIVKARSTNNIS